MGRGGGSHGGGGHFGGRSFGGRSGSNPGSSGPGFGGPSPGGPFPGGPFPGGPYRRFGPGFPGGFQRWGGPVRRGGGCGCSTGAVIVIILIIFLFNWLSSSGNIFQDNTNTEVTQSQTERTAYTGTKTYPDWYLDELGFIRHDTDLTDGLKYFYSKTGIQPYVMLLDYDPSLWNNGSWNETAANEYLAQVYKETFSDNGHMIFAYFACENDSENMDGTFYIYYGSAAYSIMDKEAESIFWSYFDMNYNDLDLSIAQFMGETFKETADNIMHIEDSGNSKVIKAATVFAVICVIVIVVMMIIVRKIKHTEEPE